MKARLALPLAALFSSVTSLAAAQDGEPAPPVQEPEAAPPSPTIVTPQSTPVDTPSEQPAKARPLFRDDGLVLGLDFAFGRAIGDASDRLNSVSPTYLPVGLSASFRTSQRVMLGMHAHAALASREDCVSTASVNCTARDYGVGAHVESAVGTPGTTLVPWFRYGLGWELLYRGGIVGLNDAYSYRHALKLIDARFGLDFVVHRTETGKTTRIGPFLGMIAGVAVGDFGSYESFGTRRDIDRPNGDAHLWFLLGIRATTDP